MPYVPGNASAPEPTSYSLLALRNSQALDSAGRTRSVEWIARYVDHSGDASDAQPQWTKALCLLALQRLQVRQDLRDRLIRELMAVRVERSPAAPNDELDGRLRGWAWVDSTFSWVEPTSYALLALKSAGQHKHERIQEAERLLLDRVCADGGWNYGNRKVRNGTLTSMMPPTALAAMALQGTSGTGTILGRAFELLDREVAKNPSSMSLALTILCFDVFGRANTHLIAPLIGRQQPNGTWRNQLHLTALSVLALQAVQEGSNVFRT